MTYEEWYERYYRKWLAACRQELRDKVDRGLWPWVKAAIAKCEIWEDGSVHMRGTLITADNWVTPWAASPHFHD